MSAGGRKSLFISHANPEDNAFTLWLGAHLSALGYDVWADVLKLVGGFDWQSRLENALRNETGKLLLVGTPDAVKKQLVRNEVQIAYDISKKIGDKEFIIPLRLKEFEAPFLVAHAQYIKFENQWSQGLSELLEALDSTYKFPRSSGPSKETLGYWRAVQLVHAQEVVDKPEKLISNWLAVSGLPEKIYIYDFKAGINLGKKERALDGLSLPIALYGRGFIGFGSIAEYGEHFGEDLPLFVMAEIQTEDFIANGSSVPKIERSEARSIISNILRQAIEDDLTKRGLSTFSMSSRSRVFWPTTQLQPPEYVKFSWTGGPTGRRKITGASKKRNFYWHLAVTARPRLFPIKHVRIGLHVIFSLDGTNVVSDAERMHRLRRSFCKQWRNPRWRDMLLAFLAWWGRDGAELRVAVSPSSSFVLATPPITFLSDVMPSRDAIDQDDIGDDTDDGNDEADPDEDFDRDGDDDDQLDEEQ